MPDGKPANEFAFNGEPKNKEFAEKIIAGTNESWKKLISGASASGGLNTNNTTLNNEASLDQEAANAIISQVFLEKPCSTKCFITSSATAPNLCFFCWIFAQICQGQMLWVKNYMGLVQWLRKGSGLISLKQSVRGIKEGPNDFPYPIFFNKRKFYQYWGQNMLFDDPLFAFSKDWSVSINFNRVSFNMNIT